MAGPLTVKLWPLLRCLQRRTEISGCCRWKEIAGQELFLRPGLTRLRLSSPPDGRWLAYASDASGRPEVYVQPLPGPGAKRQISADAGSSPVWSANGRKLFYRQANRLMVVDIRVEPFQASRPRVLLENIPESTRVFWERDYDVTPDGRFFMIAPDKDEQTATELQVILNWFEELKRIVQSRQE